ncbi:hypothetical protein CkaCkLH20_07513 [Colletotrichum karsti]|uniref:Uncharacterized protein n=1 Tax=Colletotrichum karsti TaxID=1095194 RepID=A0A9P6I231_9PEZI|nr:uncharacterized protein CkaCkLH20_07513 [Colletotrichum karsti]KAF9874819.1 hypothetical protein CkaCkLH20_07513 [Colletotrichum karsti]
MASDTKYDSHLEEGLLPVATDEKRGSTISRTTKEPTRKMTGPRRVLIAFVVCGLMTLSLASVLGHRGMPCARGHKSQALLTEDDLKDPAKVDLIHQLLHAYYPDRYQDGVYPSDKEAIEAAGADDAKLASALLQLAKRQDNTTASASATQPSETASATVATTPSSETPANTPTPTPTTAPTTTAPRETTSAAPPETTTTPPAETTTTQQPPSTQDQPTTTPQTTNQPEPTTTPTTPATSAAPNSDDDSWVSFFFPSPFYYPLFCSHYGLPGVFECVRVGYVYLLLSSDYYGRDILVPNHFEFVPYYVEFACVVFFIGNWGGLYREDNTRQTTAATSSRRTTTSFSEVRSTFTSTASNGDVVLVTATSVVAVPPEAEPTSSSGGGSGGGLQNAAVPIGSVNFGLPLAIAGFVAGAMLLL